MNLPAINTDAGDAGRTDRTVPFAAHDLPADELALTKQVCALLDEVGCGEDTRAAAWWYALARTRPEIWRERSAALPEILRRLVEGQREAERVWALHAQRGAQGGAEGLRRLLLAIIRDLRVVYLLLARQLASMRAAMRWPQAQRRELAELTTDIHAPLANRLGIWQWKWELEDLAFRFSQPDTYKRIALMLDERRADRENFIADCVHTLRDALRREGVDADVAGRPKHIHSIWKKMHRKDVGFGELYDIRALRVLTGGVDECYAALGVVHSLWANLPGEFDDYIARPKGNDYRSLHTAVIGPQGKTLEVQIRTREMHRAAELGVAAHWRYKEGGGSGDAAYQARVAWMRRLLESREGEDDAALLAGSRGELAEERVYLLTPKGEVFDLAAGATVLDFAYHVHTMVGHRCRGAKVNGRIVPLTRQPVSGDRVEILTAKEPAPRRDWLSPHQAFLHTASARGKVRAWFRRADQAGNLAAGRQIFDRELKRLAFAGRNIERVYLKLAQKSHEDLLIALALGEVSTGQLARALGEDETSLAPSPQRAAARLPPPKPGALTIEGVGNLLNVLARCCQPLPGDAVAGFITRGRGVTVHRDNCASLARLRARAPERVIEVHWGSAPERAYQVDIAVSGYDRKNLHRDVTTAIGNAGAHIVASSSRSDPARGEVSMRFSLRLRDFAELSALLAKLAALPNVIDARRLAAG